MMDGNNTNPNILANQNALPQDPGDKGVGNNANVDITTQSNNGGVAQQSAGADLFEPFLFPSMPTEEDMSQGQFIDLSDVDFAQWDSQYSPFKDAFDFLDAIADPAGPAQQAHDDNNNNNDNNDNNDNNVQNADVFEFIDFEPSGNEAAAQVQNSTAATENEQANVANLNNIAQGIVPTQQLAPGPQEHSIDNAIGNADLFQNANGTAPVASEQPDVVDLTILKEYTASQQSVPAPQQAPINKPLDGVNNGGATDNIASQKRKRDQSDNEEDPMANGQGPSNVGSAAQTPQAAASPMDYRALQRQQLTQQASAQNQLGRVVTAGPSQALKQRWDAHSLNVPTAHQVQLLAMTATELQNKVASVQERQRSRVVSAQEGQQMPPAAAPQKKKQKKSDESVQGSPPRQGPGRPPKSNPKQPRKRELTRQYRPEEYSQAESTYSRRGSSSKTPELPQQVTVNVANAVQYEANPNAALGLNTSASAYIQAQSGRQAITPGPRQQRQTPVPQQLPSQVPQQTQGRPAPRLLAQAPGQQAPQLIQPVPRLPTHQQRHGLITPPDQFKPAPTNMPALQGAMFSQLSQQQQQQQQRFLTQQHANQAQRSLTPSTNPAMMLREENARLQARIDQNYNLLQTYCNQGLSKEDWLVVDTLEQIESYKKRQAHNQTQIDHLSNPFAQAG